MQSKRRRYVNSAKGPPLRIPSHDISSSPLLRLSTPQRLGLYEVTWPGREQNNRYNEARLRTWIRATCSDADRAGETIGWRACFLHGWHDEPADSKPPVSSRVEHCCGKHTPIISHPLSILPASRALCVTVRGLGSATSYSSRVIDPSLNSLSSRIVSSAVIRRGV